jgi:hypothetical protein
MKVRRLLLCCTVLGALAATYVASPFYAMWNLREAVKRGDTAAIEERVEWPTVRESLKASLARHPSLIATVTAAGGDVTPSVWQRIKGAFGATMVDRFIETYVTPEGLPKLLDYRRLWQDNVSGGATAEPVSRIERMRNLWARVTRAEFQSLTRVEIEMQDRRAADRRYVSVLELDGYTWKLTGLRVVVVNATGRLAELEGQAKQTR